MAHNGYYQLLLLIPVAVMIISDFKIRMVNIIWLSALGVMGIVVAIYTAGVREALWNSALNLLLLTYLSIAIILYLRLKNRKWVNPLNRHIGTGDLIFLLMLTPLFNIYEYLLFILCTLIGSLVWFALYFLLLRKSHTIPLVGTAGVTFILFIIIKTTAL